MNGKHAKKYRRETRPALKDLAQPEVKWFARPLALRLWFKPLSVLARFAVRAGWRSLGPRWVRFVNRLPDAGIKYVLRDAG
jgi:hypothetical protein